MKFNDLKTLLVAASNPTKNNLEFSNEEVQSAATNALVKYFGLEDLSIRSLNKHRNEIFEVINEVVDEVLPRKLEDRISDFAEIKQIARNEEAIFTVKSTLASKRRLMKGIQKGARGGIYKARRLDDAQFKVTTMVETVGYMITLEEILTGQRTIKELIDVLADAWTEKIFYEVFMALSSAAQIAPAINQVTGSNTAIDNAELDKIVAIVAGYGQPRILGFRQHLALLGNNYITNQAGRTATGEDAADIRAKGYVGIYKGTNVIELPNYISAHLAASVEWVFPEERLFILPVNEKPVKIVLQGESYTAEVSQPHGGIEFHQHRLMGIGVLFNNYIASYELVDIWNED